MVVASTGVDSTYSVPTLKPFRLCFTDFPSSHIDLVTDYHYRDLLIPILVYLPHPKLDRVEGCLISD